MAGPLKIVFYIHALAGGGAERVWTVLATALAARGHEVVFAVDREAGENRSRLGAGVRLAVLGPSHARSVMALSGLLAAESPDIVVAALAAANLKLALAAALAGDLRRTILTWHGYAESEPQRLSQLGFRALPLLSRLVGATVAVSDGLLDYLRSRWRASTARTMRIYNPVHVGRSGAAETSGPEPEGAIVLAAGRLVSYKDFKVLISAFARSTHADSRLIIIGEGPERDDLQREVARLGLASRVEMPGYVAEPWHYYAAARCFVLPSRSEAFGLVLVEAMAHGIEIVATDCHGPREILEAGRHGRLVPVGDPDAMAKAIDAALDRPSDPTDRQARARAFDTDAATRAYEDLFRAIAARAPRRVRLKPTHVPVTGRPVSE